MRKLLKLVALGRAARLGPVGLAVAAYGLWRQMSEEDRERVRQRLMSLWNRARSRATAAPLEPRASTVGET
jgi:hypothetical protein